MKELIADIRSELISGADENTKSSAKRYFKEDIKVHGVRTGAVSKISNKYFEAIKTWKKEEIFSLCEELFNSGYMEESFLACNFSYGIRERFEEKDFSVFERWVRDYVSNWATCDTLCNHTIGAFIEQFPEYIKNLKSWAKSGNRWMRRAAAVTLIIPAKRGEFLKEAFEISDILMDDKENLVQKGYGWLLKEESRKRQEEVFKYVMKNKKNMPRTALRYAIELMPRPLKERAMARE